MNCTIMYWRDRHSHLRGFRRVSVSPAVWKMICIIAGIALILVVVYFGPIFLVHQQGGLSAAEHLKATNDARTSLAAVATAAGLAVGLFFTARTFMLSRTAQNTDRYQAAIRQLGDECLTVRIGGIYALEELARDAAWKRQTISDVLVSFISNTKAEYRSLPADIQAALTVLARRLRGAPLRPVDLSGAILTGADLPENAQLQRAQLKGTQLRDAKLADACLQYAVMQHAKLPGADLSNANLRHADLTDADLHNARLYHAMMQHAKLPGADLSNANLRHADLTDADLTDADLTDADLDGVTWTGQTTWPSGNADQVRACSREIRPGLYRVSQGSGCASTVGPSATPTPGAAPGTSARRPPAAPPAPGRAAGVDQQRNGQWR